MSRKKVSETATICQPKEPLGAGIYTAPQGSLRLTVPMPSNLTNVGSRASRHWRTAYKAKKDYWALLDLMQLRGELPPPPKQPFAQCSLRSVMYLGGAMDDDNAMARHKSLLDWLKTRGYVADDRRKNIRWEGLPEQVIKRDGNYRIVLTLTPITLESAA